MVRIHIASHARATAPITDVSNASWNNLNFVEDITPLVVLEPTVPRLHAEWSDYWSMGMSLSRFIVWETGSGDIDILFVRINTWNASYVRTTAPISSANCCFWNNRNFTKWDWNPRPLDSVFWKGRSFTFHVRGFTHICHIDNVSSNFDFIQW